MRKFYEFMATLHTQGEIIKIRAVYLAYSRTVLYLQTMLLFIEQTKASTGYFGYSVFGKPICQPK